MEARLLTFVTAFRRGWLAAGTAVLTGILVSPVFGAAQPTSPLAGATTSSHPTFTWSLPANEEADWLSIATRPATTPNGEFFNENVSETGFLGTGTQTQWTSADALFADSYWWNVRSHDRDTFSTIFSQPPASFNVAPETRINRVRVTRHSYTFVHDDLSIVVRWTTNVREVAVEATIKRGNRRVGLVRTKEETFLALTQNTAYLTWNRASGVRTGTRLTLTISVRGGGRVASVRRLVRAP